MDLRIATATDVGRVRKKNDDSVLADVPLIAVADGMGGYEGGDVASKLAMETLSSWKDRFTGKSGKDVGDLLRQAFLEANRAVHTKGREDPNLSRMGTTLTAGWIDSNVLVLAHVGDSRAYLLRGGELNQLTNDQTVADDLRRRGRISEDEAAASPQRHILLQAIGSDTDDLDIEISIVELKPGDRLLFASDGLYGMVKRIDRLRDVLAQNADPEMASRILIDEANAAGGEDNISVLIVDVVGEPGTEAVAPSGDAIQVERTDGHKPVDTPPEPRTRKKFLGVPRRPLIIGVVAVLGIAAALFFVQRLSSDMLLVAERGGTVVLVRGTPGATGEPASGDVVRVFPDRVDRFPRTVREDLRSGIPVDSMADARRVVANLPRLLGPQDTPTPSPSASPSTSPSPGTSA